MSTASTNTTATSTATGAASPATTATGAAGASSVRTSAREALPVGTTTCGFTVERTEPIDELDADAFVLHHAASGARLLYLACDDENKAFAIAFKTPPANSTGVFHILEHSVLCGSEKFPVKEPFVDLIKSSMQTFLNAMTYPDKTVYPVATTKAAGISGLLSERGIRWSCMPLSMGWRTWSRGCITIWRWRTGWS